MPPMIDLVVHGAAGRMGRRIIELALEAPEHLRVFAGVDKSGPETLRGLGLGKIRRTRTLEDTPSVRGMINAVKHLVEIVEEGK